MPIAAPLVRENVRTALEFFQSYMPTLDDKRKGGFLRGMDVHKGVAVTRLVPGTVLVAYRLAVESPYKLFYTKVGTSMDHLGVNPADRGFRRFRVRLAAPALVSRASDIRDTWSIAGLGYLAGGGGLQYIIPNAELLLDVVS
jgi:hypothetical protein